VKPLYYHQRGGLLAFASRPRALLRMDGVSKEVDRRFAALFAVSHYRTFDNDPEASPYVDIAQLPAGHLMRVTDGTVVRSRWWTLEPGPDHHEPEAELAERYRQLLLDAVDIRLRRSPAPVFTLSGGMDSSSVLAGAVHLTGDKQHAISSVYEDTTYDESDEIRSMLDAAVERWHQVAIGTPELVPTVSAMIDANDEPVATATWLSHYLLSEQAAQLGFGSVFGGLGGDELNAGEYEYFFFRFADLAVAGDEAALRHETREWIRHHDHPIFRKSFETMREGLRRLVDLDEPGRCVPDFARIRRYGSALAPGYWDLDGFVPEMDRPFTSYLRNRTYQDIFRETAPCCLRAADRQTRAFGLDVVWPFFDHRLAELMFRVPGEMQIRDGVTKRLLRDATRELLPEETRTRIKKTGWNAPAHAWFSGPGRDTVLDLAHSESFRSRGIYDVAEVERLVDEHEEIVSSGEPRENHMMFLWQLVNLELWLRWLDEL
jgi:asparagine synthase (glutamine-hydrolysing)